ncbi:MAG: endo-1,4-beta-xylanase [Eubacteriales bacterium]|nr:endo-1,4-beta-xylanase [Eubacteriales bacterium]MDD3882073.1 endo-1,4-beta-xylanase [Eubacteriales bacterium]MDD4512520.1 endo-1,4-beta-xylanase [Eubacteriales bacterium]
MAEHFPECYQWDVVNEAVSDKQEEYLRVSPWTSCVGDDFIAEAFRHAAACLPKGSLIYNDYNACTPDKRDKIIRVITDMKDRGIPVDGVGLQGHWNIEFPTLEMIEEAICAYTELGLRIQLTELDMSVKNVMSADISGMSRPSEELREKQIQRWADVFEIFKKYASAIDSVTFWGAADDVTWLDKLHRDGFSNMPLLFADCAHSKPEFDRVCEVAGK